MERVGGGRELIGLAGPYVGGEAGAAPKPGEEIEPAQSCLLIGPQRRLQGLARINLGQAVRAPASLERLGEPGTGLDMSPLRGWLGAGPAVDFGSRQQTHGLTKRHAFSAGY